MNRVVYANSILLFISTLCLQQPLSAEIYRWVDSKGQVHFSDAKNKPGHINKTESIEVTPNVVKTQPGLTPKPKRSVTKKKPRKSATMNSHRYATTNNDKKCARAKEKLDNVRSRMRAGYTAAQQRKLHNRELRYMEERSQYCN